MTPRSRWLAPTLALAVLAVVTSTGTGWAERVSGTEAAGRLTPTEGVTLGTTPDGTRVALSSAIDAGTLVLQGRSGQRWVYLAEGAGPASGMRCIVVAGTDHTNTACDTPAQVRKSGLLVSGETRRATLEVTGYMPGAAVPLALGGLGPANGEAFAVEVPETQARLTLEVSGLRTSLVVPGGGSQRLLP